MYFVIVTIDAGRPATEAECTGLYGAILAVGELSEPIQHVYARPSDAGLDLVLFVTAPCVEEAEAVACLVVSRGIAATTRNLRISSCGVDLFAPWFSWAMNPR
jgi:hypothetical protein